MLVSNNCNVQLKNWKFHKYFIPPLMHNAQLTFYYQKLTPSKRKHKHHTSQIRKGFLHSFSRQFSVSKFVTRQTRFDHSNRDKFVHTNSLPSVPHHIFLWRLRQRNMWTRGQSAVSAGLYIRTISALRSPRRRESSQRVGLTQPKADRALQMWQRCYCKGLIEYRDLYLTRDVTLLADVFENFGEMALL